MKLALFVHDFPPEFLGGTEQVVLALAHSYQDSGHEVVVVAGSQQRRAESDPAIVTEAHEGLRVLRLRRSQDENYGICLDWPRVGGLVTDILVEEQPDAVHVHHWSTLGHDILQRAAALGIVGGATLHDLWTTCPRFFRRPPSGVRCPLDASRESCVTCASSDLPHTDLKDIAKDMERRDKIIGREIATAAFVAVPSEAQAKLLHRHAAFRTELEIIPHGLLAPVPERALPRAAGAPFRVGSFGNVVPEKGFDLIVEALGHLGEEVELRISGRCPHAGYVEALERRARTLGVPFTYTGPYGPGDRHPALDLDLAIFPSLCHESYGLVVDEALARGVPVVVSGRGALPERAERGGKVVRQGGVGPLEVALANLLRSHRQLEALRSEIPTDFPTIRQAADRYIERFTSLSRVS
ncbi:MAG: glycosyltransferase [Planctomycetes bacterium]|nr:glycosyltransferase [Planctomycetota bacterium]